MRVRLCPHKNGPRARELREELMASWKRRKQDQAMGELSQDRC